jgi:hypothetical protein
VSDLGWWGRQRPKSEAGAARSAPAAGAPRGAPRERRAGPVHAAHAAPLPPPPNPQVIQALSEDTIMTPDRPEGSHSGPLSVSSPLAGGGSSPQASGTAGGAAARGAGCVGGLGRAFVALPTSHGPFTCLSPDRATVPVTRAPSADNPRPQAARPAPTAAAARRRRTARACRAAHWRAWNWWNSAARCRRAAAAASREVRGWGGGPFGRGAPQAALRKRRRQRLYFTFAPARPSAAAALCNTRSRQQPQLHRAADGQQHGRAGDGAD